MKQTFYTIIFPILILLLIVTAIGQEASTEEAVNFVRTDSRPSLTAVVDTTLKMTKEPVFRRIPNTSMQIEGFVGTYLDSITKHWLCVVPTNNPGMLGMFNDRNCIPPHSLLPWSGEFAGKYLTGAVEVLRLTNSKELRNYLAGFVPSLVALQAEDGYLGPWPKEYQFTGKAPNIFGADIGGSWDTWNHYHIMMGLLLWYEQSEDLKALDAAKKIGDLLCKTFLGKPGSFAGIGSSEMNLAPIHSLCLLYRETENQRYLDLARQILEDEFPISGKWFETAMEGKEFYQTPLPRWESLHPIMGIAELYWLTGDPDYKKAFEHIWWSIVKLDRHNTGGFSSGEKAQGNPYHPGVIETCCTVAWTAMSVEMLKLTGNSVVADELELSFLNATLASQSRTGKWSTYNTPMDGKRIPNTEAISFQKRPGTEELNCCSANAPRPFGMISDWSLMTDEQGLILNWYGLSEMSTKTRGVSVTLQQQTDYPRTGKIMLKVSPSKPVSFTLKLRIPYWSEKNRVAVNGKIIRDVQPGSYLAVDRKWKQGDIIEIELDMSLHYWVGEKECEGKTSIYHGPLLLAYNTENSAKKIEFTDKWDGWGAFFITNQTGATVRCTFFGDYISWTGTRRENGGKTQVKIDGVEVAIVDQYSPVNGEPFYWEHKGIKPGRHEIELRLLTEKNNDSKGNCLTIEGFSTLKELDIPVFDAKNMKGRVINTKDDSLILMEFTDVSGKKVNLIDFASAGENWQRYISWLKVRHVSKTPFSKTNPLRSSRVSREISTQKK